ncbi:MAG: hypothetical protein LBC19_01135 [Tannerella sp.]|nr:hypothetical protein [Tannerella sp.]
MLEILSLDVEESIIRMIACKDADKNLNIENEILSGVTQNTHSCQLDTK